MASNLPSSPGPSGSGEEEKLDEAWNDLIFLEDHEEGNKDDWKELSVSDDEDDEDAGDPVPSQAPEPAPEPAAGDPGPSQAPEPAAGAASFARGVFLPFDPLPSQAPMEVQGSPPRHWLPRDDHTFARYRLMPEHLILAVLMVHCSGGGLLKFMFERLRLCCK